MKYRSNEARTAIFHCKGGPMKHRNTPRGGSRKIDHLEDWGEDDPDDNIREGLTDESVSPSPFFVGDFFEFAR